MTQIENRLNELFEELVPASGTADTVAGEIIRAISRIGYRWVNDGDAIGHGYGRETCNPAARFLISITGDENIENAIFDMWKADTEAEYEELLADLESHVLEYVETHEELKKTKNEQDMFDFRDDEEDVDYYDEDEDEAESWWF